MHLPVLCPPQSEGSPAGAALSPGHPGQCRETLLVVPGRGVLLASRGWSLGMENVLEVKAEHSVVPRTGSQNKYLAQNVRSSAVENP